MKIINVCGARPNFMKIAPLMDEFARYPEIDPLLVQTGQHYDEQAANLANGRTLEFFTSNLS